MAKLVSKTYGDALFAVALEESRMDEFFEAVKVVADILRTNDEFGKLMNHPKIMKEDKVKIVEDLGYDNLVVSIKSSDVMMCAKAHELIAEKCKYPLHVGITESGTVFSGNIKSSVGLGIILSQGIGDTIRVSLTGDPVEEIKTAKLVLRTLGLRKGGIEVVSCPTCGRPYRPGSEVCPHCSDKKKIVLRTWKLFSLIRTMR